MQANDFLSLKLADMEYTRTILSSDSYDQYWNYWIHTINLTQHNHYPTITRWDEISLKNEHYYDPLNDNDMPPLFLKHQQFLYCCFVILVSASMLHMYGVKLWEKY
jgi:hypothetical protein